MLPALDAAEGGSSLAVHSSEGAAASRLLSSLCYRPGWQVASPLEERLPRKRVRRNVDWEIHRSVQQGLPLY
jgi:hypothetical protein